MEDIRCPKCEAMTPVIEDDPTTRYVVECKCGFCQGEQWINGFWEGRKFEREKAIEKAEIESKKGATFACPQLCDKCGRCHTGECESKPSVSFLKWWDSDERKAMLNNFSFLNAMKIWDVARESEKGESYVDPSNEEVNVATESWFNLLSSDWIDYVGGNKLDAAKEGFRHGFTYGVRHARKTARGEG